MSGSASSPASLFMRITGGRLKTGHWPKYEEAHKGHVLPHASLPGLVGRWLIKDTGDEDTGFSISIWASREAMEMYERSDSLKREILPHVVPHLTSTFVAHHCEVRYQEIFSTESETTV